MADQAQQRPAPAIAVDALLDGELAETVTAEEADAEIEVPGVANAAAGAQVAPGDTTPAVRIAIDKAADMLRQLRGE